MIRVVRVSLAGFSSRLVVVLALLASFGLGGFLAVKALAEDTKPEPSCTEIGCMSGISVQLGDLRHELPRAASVELCTRAGCMVEKVGRGEAPSITKEWRGVPKYPTASYTADVTVLDRHGDVLLHIRRSVRLSKFEPNGHGCEPTCWNAALKLDATRGRLVPVRS
jgi:hypothetical protein